MIAIYKREVKSCLTSMYGAIAISVMLLIVGYMFRYYNLHNGASSLVYAVFNSNLIFYIVVPVLTMRSFAEERRQKTDQLLLTAPVSPMEIVMGKYLALITVYAIPCLVMCVLPLIISPYGEMTYAVDYVSILIFFLIGCAYLACGMFISSLTDNQIIAAIGSLLFVFLTMILHNTYTLVSANSFPSMVMFVILAVIAGAIVVAMTSNFTAGICTTAVCAAAVFIAYFVKQDWFAGKPEMILKCLDFYSHFESFAYSSFKVADLLYFVSVAVIGIVLTFTSLQRRRWN